MIIFHEGLPGSGKSYEAVVKHLLDALRSGRKVFAYVEGLNHSEFARELSLPIERVQELLITIDRDQVNELPDMVEDNAFVVIDEIGNIHPGSRHPLDEKWRIFVKEHRHRGLDILLMDQDLRDVHSLWKRRVDTKITFLKMSAVGRDQNYKWTAYKAVSGEKFQKISSGVSRYEERYFPLYSSHVGGHVQTGNYQDERTNIFRTAGFKYGVPVFGIVLAWSLMHLIEFFTPSEEAQAAVVEKPASSPTPVVSAPTSPVIEEPRPVRPRTLVDSLMGKYRPRYAGSILIDQQIRGYVQFLDESLRVGATMTLDQIMQQGWGVRTYHDIGVTDAVSLISPDGVETYVISWPLETRYGIAETVRTSPELGG